MSARHSGRERDRLTPRPCLEQGASQPLGDERGGVQVGTR